MRIRLKIDNGRLVEGKDQLGALIHSLNGEYIATFLDLSSPNTVEEWRKLYFALRDILHESVETGYTKAELHEVIKLKIMEDMWDYSNNPDWWTGEFQTSTKNLTEAGWVEFMKRFKEFAMDTFEIYL